MNCPVCDTPLRAIQKYGVDIDICPGCKGIWLDRGELEKIIELVSVGDSAREETSSTPTDSYRREAQPRYHDEHRCHDDGDDQHNRSPQYDQHGRRSQNRRGSWLGDLLGGFGGDD